MQQVVKLLVLFAVSCSFNSGSIAQKPGSRTRKPPPPPIICKKIEVPNGMVVVGYKRNSACSDGTELLVKRPETGDIICADSPVPPQFSIVTEAQGRSVGTCRTKAFLISRVNPDPDSEGRVDDDAIGRAFASRSSDIQVEGEGTVLRVLPDDLDQPRHQRFVVQLASGQTLLVTHNIDIAPRIVGLAAGDSVRFNGEYVWNAKGGVIHWTHHDPKGKHVAGWVIHNGKTYK
jgi:hypothetical protein